jgi:periplasmic protein TonB
MEIQQIPQADLLDILFEGRNKDYGAYDLRKTYNRRLTKALMLAGSICLAMIGSYILAGKLNKGPIRPPDISGTIILTEAPPLKEKTPEPPSPPKPKPLLPEQVATIRDATPRITPDDQVKPEDVPPANSDIDNMKIGILNKPGDVEGDIVAPPTGDGMGTGVTAALEKKNSDDEIFRTVEIEASYEGGPEAWKRFLLKNFHCPEQAIAEETSETVIVEFIVDKEGNVSNVQAISGPELLKQEAMRVIKKSGKWSPAIQNGRRVISYKKQPIVVQLQNE